MAETMSPIERTCSLLTQNVSKGDMREFIGIAVEAGVHLYKEKQQDETTRKQGLNELRGALNAVSHLSTHRTPGAR